MAIKSNWNDYKKTITNLTDDQLEALETEATKVADALNKKDVDEADKQ